MPLASDTARMTVEEYLAWEAEQPDKHEYVAGEIFAMVGVRQIHSIIAGNIFSELHLNLKGKPCRPHFSDMKLCVKKAEAIFYPDIMVSCDERDKVADLQLEHPKLIVEVLSESTASYDLGAKFEMYRMIPELEEYVVVDPDRRRIYAYRSAGNGDWLMHDFGTEEQIRFASLGITMQRADVFEGCEEDKRNG